MPTKAELVGDEDFSTVRGGQRLFGSTQSGCFGRRSTLPRRFGDASIVGMAAVQQALIVLCEASDRRCSVKRYLAAGGWAAIRQPRRLDGLEEWLGERFRQHRGNCDVVRQDLLREHGIVVSLRTVERAMAPVRQALRAEARATLRLKTPPGRQLQIDFGTATVPIVGAAMRAHLFVATLGLRGGCLAAASQFAGDPLGPHHRS